MKYKCSKRAKDVKDIYEIVKNHPAIVTLDESVDNAEDHIQKIEQEFKLKLDAYKIRIKNIKKLLKKRKKELVNITQYILTINLFN